MASNTTSPTTRPASARRSFVGKRSRSEIWREDDELDRTEVISAVSSFFVKGLTVKQILAAMAKEYPQIKLKREDPYALVREAAKKGWLAFHAPQHWQWTKTLQDDYPWLQSVRVVHTTANRAVALSGAESLLRLLKGYRRSADRREVHIGFSGGHTMRALSRAFAGLLLSEPTDSLPEKVVIHAMAAGFDPRDPTTDPNTFCSYFTGGLLNDIQVEFFGLSAPSLVQPEGIRALRDMPHIQEAFAAVRDLDIIVASGSSWLDPHAPLRTLMYRSPECKRVLEEEECIGDVLWRPVSDRGSIEKPTSVRALTLVELSELPALIQQGKHVLLTLGPCGLCHAPKGRLLLCLLRQRRPLMTDLVVDSRTVAEMMRLLAETPGH